VRDVLADTFGEVFVLGEVVDLKKLQRLDTVVGFEYGVVDMGEEITLPAVPVECVLVGAVKPLLPLNRAPMPWFDSGFQPDVGNPAGGFGVCVGRHTRLFAYGTSDVVRQDWLLQEDRRVQTVDVVDVHTVDDFVRAVERAGN